MCPAVVAQVVQNDRGILGDSGADRAFAVQDTHGVLFQTGETGLAQLVLFRFKIRPERLVVFRTTGGAADGVDVQHDVLESGTVENGLCQRNDLSVRSRSLAACHFDAELVELPESACLRTLVAETGQDIIYLLGKCIVEQTVLEYGPDRAGCSLRTQGELGFLCLDGIHFFLYHICGFAHRTQEQVGAFKGGDACFVKAEILRCFPCNAFHRMPLVDLLGCHIFCSLGTCDFDCHV